MHFNKKKNLTEHFFSLNRYTKRGLAVLIDTFFCVLSLWLAFYLRLEEFILFREIGLTPILITIFLAISIFWITGLYQTLFRNAALTIISTALFSVVVYGIIFFSIISVYGIKGVPRSIGVIQPILLFVLIITSRSFIKYLFTGMLNKSVNDKDKENVLIYGAGIAGRQLFISLEENKKYKVLGFLDDDFQMHKQYLLGQKIYDPEDLENLKYSKNIKLILIAIPSLSKNKKNEIIQNISNHQIPIKTLPNLSDIIDDKLSFSDVKDFLIEDLLDREIVAPNYELLSKNVKSKVMIAYLEQ